MLRLDSKDKLVSMRWLFCHHGFLSFKQTENKLSVWVIVTQTISGTFYSAFLTGLIHCNTIMLIVSDRVGSLGEISWWDGLRLAVRIQIFTGNIKAWVVYLLYVYCTLQNEFSGEQYYGQDVLCTMFPSLGVLTKKGQQPYFGMWPSLMTSQSNFQLIINHYWAIFFIYL